MLVTQDAGGRCYHAAVAFDGTQKRLDVIENWHEA